VHISCSGQTCRWRVRPGTTGSLPLPPRALLAPAARHAPPPISVVETPVVSSTTRRARPKPSSAARAHDSTLTPIGSAKGAATRAATATRRRHAPPRDPLRKGSTAALGGAGTRAPAFVLTAGRPTAALAATLARRTARRFRSGQGTFAHQARTGAHSGDGAPPGGRSAARNRFAFSVVAGRGGRCWRAGGICGNRGALRSGRRCHHR
jgi:hypothetical protein